MTKDEKDAGQLERFKKTARALECDEDKARFEAKLGKLVKRRPAASGAKNPRLVVRSTGKRDLCD
jgi:hypothetical protein